MLLFLANYPDEKTKHEGMSQRVIAIDQQYSDKQRCYLLVSYRLYWKKDVVRLADDSIQYHCNLFFHFFFVLKLFRRASTLYFHSVLNVLPVLPFLWFIHPPQRVVLDAHGLVPEEQRIAGTKWKSMLYYWSERRIFRRADVIISVTKAMERHFQEKYPQSSVHYFLLPIMPAHLKNDHYLPARPRPESPIRVVYSGNTQPWQNVDLMIEVIKHNLSDRMHYDLLTGEPETMNRYLAAAGLLGKPNIQVKTVAPNALKTYYANAHYGFMLRGDIDVSRASCPTKMIEYMYYGIIPIMKTREIGDFNEMGMESVLFDEFSERLGARKSLVNHKLIAGLLANERELLADLDQLIA